MTEILLQMPWGQDSNILWYIILYLPFFFFLFYGQRFQMFMAQLEIGSALKRLEKMKNFARGETLQVFEKAGCEGETARRSLDLMVNYFTILPESMDPAGIVYKLEHVLDVRETKLHQDVKNILPSVDDVKARNVGVLIEATAALEQIYKIIRHFYLLGKKTGNVYLVIQLQMILSLVMLEAKAYLSAIYAFENGLPIGDGIGALVAAKMAQGTPAEEIAKDTMMAKIDFEGREVFVVKAQGPGGNIGKTGEGIKRIIEENGERIKLIITVDAKSKLEGEKVGDIAEGVGAAIGGMGVDKFKLEEVASQNKIPLYAVGIKESIAEVVSVMKKEIYDSVNLVLERVKKIILENTKEREGVIVAGIGNTVGIAQ